MTDILIWLALGFFPMVGVYTYGRVVNKITIRVVDIGIAMLYTLLGPLTPAMFIAIIFWENKDKELF